MRPLADAARIERFMEALGQAAAALAKLERGHQKDLLDTSRMADAGLIERSKLLRLLAQIEPQLYR